MKKYAWIAAAAVLLIASVLVIVAVFVLPGGCSGCSDDAVIVSSGDHQEGAQQTGNMVKKGEELLAQVETQEEAEAVAEQYGITLVRFRSESGIATFHCEGNPFDVIKRGNENGWTPLHPNGVATLSPIENAGGSIPEQRPTKPSSVVKP